jgi:hypothetical protein
MKPIFISILLFPIILACSSPEINPSIEYDEILVAQNRIIQLHKQVDALKKKFYRIPVQIHNPVWIKRKLDHIAQINHLLQNAVMTDVLTQSWPDEVKRAYVVHFINYDADPKTPYEYGYLQKQEFLNLEELKNLLESSDVLQDDNWPVISKSGEQADYNAWRIIISARTYDPAWFEKVLLPRLKRLSAKGQSSYLGYLYLKHKGNPKMRNKIIFEMKNSPSPWSQAGRDLELMEKFGIEMKRLYHLPQINLFPS